MLTSSVKILLFLLTLFLLTCDLIEQKKWYRGNLHTHSLWSDGNDFPEMIIKGYKDNGYHFVALSDHNILPEGGRWIDVKERGAKYAYEEYKKQFAERVEERKVDGRLQVRLKAQHEYAHQFDEPGRFLIISSEEITDRFEKNPVHINATNIQKFIAPQGGTSVVDVMQNNINAVLRQRDSLGTPVMPHLNHPNYQWAVTAEDMVKLEGEKFFEIYNGHPYVNNEGDSLHPSIEQMWDVVLSARIKEGKDIMYGLATDDAHHYHSMQPSRANPGRGWIYVNAAKLTAEDLISAMEQGDFYASTGVVLKKIDISENYYTIEVNARPNVHYVIEFVGTFKDSENTGEVLYHETSDKATYNFSGNELYVRARITSSVLKENPNFEGEFERAWTQPIVIN